MWVRSDTKTARREAVVAEDRRDAAERLEGRPAAVLGQDRRRRHAARDGEGPGRLAASVVRSPSALPPVTTR